MKVVNADLSTTVKFHQNYVIIVFTKREIKDPKKTHLTTQNSVCYSVFRIVETLTISGKNGRV